ncbi:P-loop containing nucleoside triphosphate hydrolase protein [Mycena rebaudengoi]|nr:P-loop containing nucleoside triphosphate hydrolase protein [Mycena rebaudengoi]
MSKPNNIRNITMVAGAGSGKSTLLDRLVGKAGILFGPLLSDFRAPGLCDYHNRSQEDLMTSETHPLTSNKVRSTSDILILYVQFRSAAFLINVVGNPGDVASELSSVLRVADGALVLVDLVYGIGEQTEIMLRQTLAERVKPVLFLNRVDTMLDCVLLGKLPDQEQLFLSFHEIIHGINNIIASHHDTALEDFRVCPEHGSVAFGSGLHGWAFTLRQFAHRYSKKFGVEEEKLMAKLWGDNFFNPKTKKWTTKSTDSDGTQLQRGFTQFIIDPIYKIIDVVFDEKDAIEPMLQKIGVTLEPGERERKGKSLLKAVMHHFLPAADSLLEMVVLCLPSPVAAQRYRVDTLYEGPMNDAAALAIKNCDPGGPLVISIFKMVSAYNGRSYALGRVFSGTIRSGQKIRIQGPKYVPGSKNELFSKVIGETVLMLSRSAKPLGAFVAGNLVGIVGIDQLVHGNGTLTDSELTHNIKTPRFSMTPLVQVTVDVQYPIDLPRLVEGLKRMSMSNSLISTWSSPSGEFIVAAACERHLESSLKLLEMHHARVSLSKSDPFASYRETVTVESTIAMSQSPNKRTRLYAATMPLDVDLTQAIEDVNVPDGFKARARLISKYHGWDEEEANKIWCFGPDSTGSNVLINATHEARVNELKDACSAAFQWVAKEGVCAEENVRGVRLISEGSRALRGNGQLIPTARRVCYAACLLATPAIQEPIYHAEIQCFESSLPGIRAYLKDRQGTVLTEERKPGTILFNLTAHLPVSESFSFTSYMHSQSALAQTVFSHWALVPGSPLEKGSQAEELVTAIRIRKGLKPQIPSLDTFHDKESSTPFIRG